MRFGVLSFGNTLSNLGDWIQSLGVFKVYQKMGIPLTDLKEINRNELTTYQGEKVILPMGGYFNKICGYECFPLSKDIIPVFFGFHCTDEKMLRYLKDYEDLFFGCRDLATADMIKKICGKSPGIFMSGCFSLCLDKRKLSKEPADIYMVDIIPELLSYIPERIKENAICLSQVSWQFVSMSNEEANQKSLATTEKWLDNLRENARLVITSRLHLALPCTAMGIPVIVARNYFDDTDRYSGYNGLFHVYMPHEFANINWEPSVPDIEWLKKELMKNASELLQNASLESKYNNNFVTHYQYQVKQLDTYFTKSSEDIIYYSGPNASYLSQSQKEHYYNNRGKYSNILEYILKSSLEDRTLVIWGAGDKGFLMMRRYAHIVDKFGKCFYVDKDSKKHNTRLNGLSVFSPDEIKKIDKNKIVIIIAVKDYDSAIGRKIAADLYHDYSFREGREFFFLDKLDSSARMALDDIALSAPLM